MTRSLSLILMVIINNVKTSGGNPKEEKKVYTIQSSIIHYTVYEELRMQQVYYIFVLCTYTIVNQMYYFVFN